MKTTHDLIEDIRRWNLSWDNFANTPAFTFPPKSIDEFAKELEERYHLKQNDMKDNRFRLEYHEGQGNFHMEWLADIAHARKADTNEWETIATDITSRQGLDFIEKMEEKYKGLPRVSAWGLRQEFAYFTGHPKPLTTDNRDRVIGFAQWLVDEGWSLHAQMGESYGKLSKVFGPPHLEYRPAKELYDDYLKELKDIDFASYCSRESDGSKSAEELHEDYVNTTNTTAISPFKVTLTLKEKQHIGGDRWMVTSNKRRRVEPGRVVDFWTTEFMDIFKYFEMDEVESFCIRRDGCNLANFDTKDLI